MKVFVEPELERVEHDIICHIGKIESFSSSTYFIAKGPEDSLVLLYEDEGGFFRSAYSIGQAYELTDWESVLIGAEDLQRLRMLAVLEGL